MTTSDETPAFAATILERAAEVVESKPQGAGMQVAKPTGRGSRDKRTLNWCACGLLVTFLVWMITMSTWVFVPCAALFYAVVYLWKKVQEDGVFTMGPAEAREWLEVARASRFVQVEAQRHDPIAVLLSPRFSSLVQTARHNAYSVTEAQAGIIDPLPGFPARARLRECAALALAATWVIKDYDRNAVAIAEAVAMRALTSVGPGGDDVAGLRAAVLALAALREPTA